MFFSEPTTMRVCTTGQTTQRGSARVEKDRKQRARENNIKKIGRKGTGNYEKDKARLSYVFTLYNYMMKREISLEADINLHL